jgi:hypothetical protein
MFKWPFPLGDRAKMAAKKTGSKSKTPPKGRTVNKSEFIRNLPATLAAAEVVKRAKAAGIKFDDKYVYRIRSLARSHRKGRAKPRVEGATPAEVASAATPTTSKAGFVRSLPATIPAKQIVAQAKAAGMKLSANYVYLIRRAARENRGAVRASRSVARPISTASSAESLLRALGAELGLSAAIAVLEAERARVRAIVAR